MPDRPDTSTAFRREANAKHAKVIADRTHWRTCSQCFQLCRLGRPCGCEIHLAPEPLEAPRSPAGQKPMRVPGKVAIVDPGAA